MSCKEVLSHVALSAACVFSGAAVAGDTANYVSPSVTALKKLAAIEGAGLTIQSCVNELDMPYKPYPQANGMHAQIVVNCAYQKSLDQFLFNPSIGRTEVAQMVEEGGYPKTAKRIQTDQEFAQKVVSECRAEEKVLREDFADCAGSNHELSEQMNDLNLIPLSLAFVGLCVGIFMVSRRRARPDQNNYHYSQVEPV